MKHRKLKTKPKEEISNLELENTLQARGWQTRIRELLEKKRMSQRALADKAGLGSTTIRHAINKAETITLETLKRIATATDMPLSYYVTGNSVLVRDLTDGSPAVARRYLLLPVHGPDDAPGEDHGLGHVCVSEKEAGTAPYAMLIEDHSMEGVGLNYTPPIQDTLVSGDIVVYDCKGDAEPGDLVVIGQKVKRGLRLSVRQLETDEGKMYATSLSRNFGRHEISAEEILGRVTTVIRSRTR